MSATEWPTEWDAHAAVVTTEWGREIIATAPGHGEPMTIGRITQGAFQPAIEATTIAFSAETLRSIADRIEQEEGR